MARPPTPTSASQRPPAPANAHQRQPTPTNPSQAMVMENVLLRVVPRRQHPTQNQCTLKPEEPTMVAS
ncbi:hypothetical protein D9D07_00160 [Corynebacterium diphtheriae]|nr:hypothetical protein D9D07_00160 [Corynebacterium diphtheriae]